MKRRTNTMTSMQQSPFERSKSHLRPKLRFRSPEKTEEWLASRKKTDYTYSNSVSYSEQLSHSEASDSEYELPIMSRRALGDVTRLSTLSTNTSATKHSSKKSRSRQTVALTPNTSDLYNDSGVMTRSRSRSSRSGTSSVYQENFMNRTRDRLTSTPLKSSPVSRTMTYITEEQSLASQTIPHLYGLDGEDETTDFPESEISCITHTDYTKQRTSSSSSSASSSSSSSIFTFITTWLMQYTVISTTVSVFQKSIQPTIWRLLWTSSSLLYRLVTLNLLGDVWLLTITRNITQRAIAVISTFISSVLHNSSSQSSSSVGAYSGNAASQWESTDMQNSKAASHSERTDMRSRSAANMEGSHGKHNNRYHDKETDELIKTTTTTVVTTVEEKDDRGGCPCLLPCLLLLFLLLGPLYYLCTSGIVPLPFLAKSTSILSKDKDSELFSSPKSVTFLIREELNKFDEKMLSQTEEKEKVPPIVEGCSDCMGRREVIELINSAISKQFDVFQDKFVMYSEHQLQKVERLKTDYENQIADLQNKLNSYNVYAVDRNDLAIGAITRLESEITSLKNDMRTIMFIAPVGEEDNVNIKEYMVENIKKLDSDVMSLDVQLTQLKENLRDLNEMHAKESNKVYSSHENIKEMLQQHKESITANITKLTLYLEVLDSSVSQLKQDLNDLHDSDDSDKTKISSIATNMNNIEIEITELRENVRVLYGHQTITSNQQSSRPEEIIILKGDVSNLKDEVSRLQSKYTEAVAYTYSNQQTLVVVQDTTSKLSTDVEGVVGELDRLKVELAGIQGQDAISVEIAMELNKLQSQINGLDSLVSILQGSVDSLQDNQGSNAESTRQVVDKLNHLENELTVFKVELRNLQHDSRTANPSNRDSEPMHTSQHILQQVNDLEVNITSLKVEMRNFIVQQDTHKGLADDVEQLTTVHNSLQSKVTDLERKTAVLQAELQQYVRDIVTAELGTLSTTTADEISRYQSYVSKLESEITAIRTNVNSIIGVHKNMTNVDYVHKFELLIQGLQEDIQNIRASQRPVTGQLSMNINNVNKLKSDMAKMEATINSLRSDFLVLQESQAAYISLDKLEEFKTSFADVNVLIMDLKTDISNVRGEGDSYKIDVINSMNKLQAEITKLKSDLRTAEITNVEGIELQDGFSGGARYYQN
uniref:Leucine-rich repeat-containing protein DDB_G0290503-like n=1 Tax=Saccoglossus kowalevskii TaxID=10224 RepID=A0ABM0MXF9_SACKO|nr:PREDICTED: putative leucine-rich repeat-containing protein DDB_G0290503-like [Saccoglossus kowalevskii]